MLDNKPISADSHVTEPPNCYIDFIEPKYRETAPHIVHDEKRGDTFIIPGISMGIPIGLIANAGKDPTTILANPTRFEELHRSGWDGKARAADQDVDGVAAEVVYPTVGMVICGHPDLDYKRACFLAYNQWLQQYVADAPGRLYGVGQLAVITIPQAIADVAAIHAQGHKGVMMCLDADTEFDFDDPRYDPLWQALVDHDLPLSFHIATAKSKKNAKEDGALSIISADVRGPKLNTTMNTIRALQDLIGMMVLGRVFERNPNLKVVCVESDAGWVPHYLQKLDHQYQVHRFWRKAEALAKLPSEFVFENVYMTFQDDYIAFQSVKHLNARRLMWANDFPHIDATWPHSQSIIARHTENLTEQEKAWILRDNVKELYHLPN